MAYHSKRMNSEKLVLPVIYPPINAFPHQGVIFSTLYAKEECIPWIFNNYIQTFSVKDMYQDPVRNGTIDFFYNLYGDWKYFEVKANPWLRTYSVPMDLIEKFDLDIVDVLKNQLSEERYAFFPIDRFCIPAYGLQYQKEHIDHDILIYGYDDHEGIFFAGDNAMNKYEQFTVKYDEIRNSFQGLRTMYRNDPDRFFYSEQSIMFFKVMKNYEVSGKSEVFLRETYDININSIIVGLKSYLLFPGYAASYSKSDYYVYGIDCYNELIKNVEIPGSLKEYIDFRGIYSFLEHKKLMLLRIKYLSKLDKIAVEDLRLIEEDYQKIVDSFVLIVSLTLKHNIKIDLGTWDKKVPQKIAGRINDCKVNEINVLTRFVNIMEQLD